MASSKIPSVQYLSGNFVISAGCVLFRRSDSDAKLQACLLYYREKSEWLLPKGRKDCGETVEAAALRETFEETGYPCELLPCRMPTRAPLPGVNTEDMVHVADDIVEPFSVVVRDQGPSRGVKLIWWYIARVKNGVDKILNTQTELESFDSHFLDIDEAVERLTFQGDRNLFEEALKIVHETEIAKGHPVV